MSSEFIGMGETKVKDPKAHPTDPRAVVTEWSNGLSKREYFAAMAMQGLAGTFCEFQESHKHRVVAVSVELADALIEELNK